MERDTRPHLDFRSWLVRKLDSKEFINLRWLDPVDRKFFKIPWNEESQDLKLRNEHKIFEAWAKNNGHDPKAISRSAMKESFQEVLETSIHVEEIREMRVEKQQTGSYRVYRLLTHAEVLGKKKSKKVKMSNVKQQPITQPNMNTTKKSVQTPKTEQKMDHPAKPKTLVKNFSQQVRPSDLIPAKSVETQCGNFDEESTKPKGFLRSQTEYNLEISDTTTVGYEKPAKSPPKKSTSPRNNSDHSQSDYSLEISDSSMLRYSVDSSSSSTYHSLDSGPSK